MLLWKFYRYEIFPKTKLNQLEDLVDLLKHKVGFNFALQTKNQDMYILLIIKSYIALTDRQVTSSREGLISVCGILEMTTGSSFVSYLFRDHLSFFRSTDIATKFQPSKLLSQLWEYDWSAKRKRTSYHFSFTWVDLAAF